MDFGDTAWNSDLPIRSTAPSTDRTNADLLQKIDRQNLMLQTLCRVLIAKGILNEEELNEWLKYVDGLDGSVDGKVTPAKSPVPCGACKRINPFKAVKCQYCGHEFEAQFLDKPKE